MNSHAFSPVGRRTIHPDVVRFPSKALLILTTRRCSNPLVKCFAEWRGNWIPMNGSLELNAPGSTPGEAGLALQGVTVTPSRQKIASVELLLNRTWKLPIGKKTGRIAKLARLPCSGTLVYCRDFGDCVLACGRNELGLPGHHVVSNLVRFRFSRLPKSRRHM